MESFTCEKFQFLPGFIFQIYAENFGPDFQGFTEIFRPLYNPKVEGLRQPGV